MQNSRALHSLLKDSFTLKARRLLSTRCALGFIASGLLACGGAAGRPAEVSTIMSLSQPDFAERYTPNRTYENGYVERGGKLVPLKKAYSINVRSSEVKFLSRQTKVSTTMASAAKMHLQSP
tara:strand:+ start:206 stop:571 length:366 start_codon:yes stop_codon:yes gene_type:complete